MPGESDVLWTCKCLCLREERGAFVPLQGRRGVQQALTSCEASLELPGTVPGLREERGALVPESVSKISTD